MDGCYNFIILLAVHCTLNIMDKLNKLGIFNCNDSVIEYKMFVCVRLLQLYECLSSVSYTATGVFSVLFTFTFFRFQSPYRYSKKRTCLVCPLRMLKQRTEHWLGVLHFCCAARGRGWVWMFWKSWKVVTSIWGWLEEEGEGDK